MFYTNKQIRIKRKLFALNKSLIHIKNTGTLFRSSVPKFFSQENINISGAAERHLSTFYRHIAKANIQTHKLYRAIRNNQMIELINFNNLE